jgi:hypothetical protein
MTELEMLRLANAGHLKLISLLAVERDDLLWQRDQLKEINDRMTEWPKIGNDSSRSVTHCETSATNFSGRFRTTRE